MSYTRIWFPIGNRGASGRNRTNDTRIFSPLLYLLSYRGILSRKSAQIRKMRYKMATRNGLEPSTSSVTGWRANRLHHRARYGGNNRARTCDLLLVRQMLSQLSYAPDCRLSVATSATWMIIHAKPHFVKNFFPLFSEKNFRKKPGDFPRFPNKTQQFLKSSRMSSGVKEYTVSQN